MKQTQKNCIKFRLFTRKVKLIKLSRDERIFILQKSNNIVRANSRKAIDCSRLDGKTFSNLIYMQMHLSPRIFHSLRALQRRDGKLYVHRS